MQPIQQGFSGYVPRELKEKYPDAKIQQQPSWCAIEGAAQLDPTDPLFAIIGRDFLDEEKKLYGAHGVYAADPFHESQPPVNTPEYLSAVGHAIFQLFQDFDPNSTWAMQAVKTSPNVCGSGLFMESIGQNPIYYDLAFEMPLHADSIAITPWLNQ